MGQKLWGMFPSWKQALRLGTHRAWSCCSCPHLRPSRPRTLRGRLPHVVPDCFIRLPSGPECVEREFAQKVLKNLKVVRRKLWFSVFRCLFFLAFAPSPAITQAFWHGGGDSRSATGQNLHVCVWRLSTQYGENLPKPDFSYLHVWGHGLINTPKGFLISEPSLTVEAAIAHPSYGLDQGSDLTKLIALKTSIWIKASQLAPKVWKADARRALQRCSCPCSEAAAIRRTTDL